MREYKCCICGKHFEGYGNNPEGAVLPGNVYPIYLIEDRCCDTCNDKYVIPGRIYRRMHKQKTNKR